MTTLSETTPPALPRLGRTERWLLAVVVPAAAGIGTLGLASSYESVSAAAAQWGFASPWMLPIGIDIAIPVFTAANLLLIRLGMALAWVRLVPWLLTGATCWLNVASGHSLSAKVAHGVMPLLWVVLSEIAGHVYAVRTGVATGRRMETIRASRWLLAFGSTFKLWRRMTLWEITSYRQGLELERQRQLARADLRQKHGRRWRKHTPRRERVLLKWGELAPADTTEPPAPPEPETPRKAPKRQPRPAPGKALRRTAEQLLADARTVTADWPIERLSAAAIRTAVGCSQANARTLREQLRGERDGGESPLHLVSGVR
ncbi:DUF2637 domain-containing protein [Streptomyces sp. A7024]|uniref:DUF2637 domain-containing protein n=1 Tax=Streptomyces coryli TaxID=1128680 RepID=A0A6G4TV60_9ACTN|nr:DUF2637 domain-containing protein [Streptomyces coryli]NGN63875.1 DUF2637 domain-containing protein [Streptomyces coryli]